MRLTNITNVFFDLDHTLWDFDKNSALTFERIFETNGVRVNTKEFLSHYEPINQNYWKLYREEKIDKASLRYGRLFDAFKAIDHKVSAELIHRLSEDYIENLSDFNHLFDGTKDILEYLQPNYKLHIITNGFKEIQQSKLEKSGISHYFNTVTNSEMVGVKKPNPRIFNFALNRSNANKANSIMIGDNLEADVIGAINMGLDAIYFNPSASQEDNQIKTVNSLSQLKEYL